MSKMSEYTALADQLNDIDVAMLFLNAGQGFIGEFKNMDDAYLEELMQSTCLHPIYLIKAMMDKLLARKKKTAVVVTASIAGLNPMPGMCAYVSAKSFCTMMAITLSYEC